MSKKRILIIAGCVVVAFAVFGALKQLHGSQDISTIKTAEVRRANIENVVSSTGTLSAIGTVEVGAQISGTLDEVFVDYNDKVEEGQLLAVLDTDLLAASVNDAEAGVMKAQAQLAEAQAQLTRNQTLHELGYLSEAEFIPIETSVDAAEAGLKSAEATLARALTNLGYAEIRSPIAGTVIERSIEPGQTIAASLQTPTLFLIAEDLTKMEIEADVDESDIGQIDEGQPVRFTVEAYPDQTFEGTVRQIRLNPKTIQNVVHYTVVLNASNEAYMLLPGMTATVDFITCQKSDVLVVPNSAVNLLPPEEVLQKPEIESERGAATTSRDRAAHYRLPEGVARVFYLDEEGLPHPALFEMGETDGVVTEVADSRTLQEGMLVITGFGEGGESGKHSTVSMRPGLGGPPMHSPGM
jgi:HlyD family secretion protein